MATKPNVADVKESSHVNRLVLEITNLNELGEQEGGPTRDIVSVEGIIGNPEGRALGSPGDIRVRQDVPEIWQKVTGQRTVNGWGLLSRSCTTIFEVGPGCQYDTINKAYTAAKDAEHDFGNQAVIVVAPQAGGYPEDLTLDQSGIHVVGAMQGASDIGVFGGTTSLILPTLVGTLTVDLALVNDLSDTRAVWAGVDIAPTTGNAIVLAGSTQYNFDFQGACADSADDACVRCNNTDAAMLVQIHLSKLRTQTSGQPVIESSATSAGKMEVLGSQVLPPDRPDIAISLDGAFQVNLRDSATDIKGTLALLGTSKIFIRSGCTWSASAGAVPAATQVAGTRLDLVEVAMTPQTTVGTDHFAGTGGLINRGRIVVTPATELPLRFAGALTVNVASQVVGADSEFFAAAVDGDWVDPNPTDTQDAINRIAAVVAGAHGAIP